MAIDAGPANATLCRRLAMEGEGGIVIMDNSFRTHLLLSLGASLLCGIVCTGCASYWEYKRLKESLDAVQSMCVESDAPMKQDGWGSNITVLTDPVLGRMAVSPAADKQLDREIEEYWELSVCGETSSPDDDIVCVNGHMRRWPPMTTVDHERVFRLPFECE